MIKLWQAGLVAVVAFVAIVAGLLWWQRRHDVPVALPPPAATSAPQAAASAPPPAVQHHPIEDAPVAAGAASAPTPPLAESGGFVSDALVALLGRPAVLRFLQTDDFPGRVVATVDALARDHAAPSRWPVNPSAGRFATETHDGRHWLAASNARRYEPLVGLVESVDAQAAAAAYLKLYPLFQQAYAELGYPGKHFNDRLVAVIDELLATPARQGALELVRTEVKGPYAVERPWVGWQYADPALESRSAGQKILLRLSPEQASRLKARLREFRAQITRAPAPDEPR